MELLQRPDMTLWLCPTDRCFHDRLNHLSNLRSAVRSNEGIPFHPLVTFSPSFAE
jgi:hypothetical protein